MNPAIMPSLFSFRMLFFLLSFVAPILAQTATSSATVPRTSSTARASTNGTTTSRTTSSPSVSTTSTTSTTAPDVYLNVPELHVGRIELIVEQLQADLNLNAKVAGLVTVNAGVQVSVQKINITIVDVDVNLELIVRLGHLVDIVERVFDSLDLNPLLIGLINNVTSLVGDVVGAVDGLLGSITQGGTTLNFLVDNLGNIVQDVTGGATGALSSIVGNYEQNMTQVGDITQLGNGLIQKTFSYDALSALVDIVFNTAGQVVQATVQKDSSSSTTSSAASSTASSTATPVTLPVSTAASTST